MRVLPVLCPLDLCFVCPDPLGRQASAVIEFDSLQLLVREFSDRRPGWQRAGKKDIEGVISVQIGLYDCCTGWNVQVLILGAGREELTDVFLLGLQIMVSPLAYQVTSPPESVVCIVGLASFRESFASINHFHLAPCNALI